MSVGFVSLFFPDCVFRKTCSQRVNSLGSHFPFVLIAHLQSLELFCYLQVPFPLFDGFESILVCFCGCKWSQWYLWSLCRFAVFDLEPICSIKKTNSCIYTGIFRGKALSCTLPQSYERRRTSSPLFIVRKLGMRESEWHGISTWQSSMKSSVLWLWIVVSIELLSVIKSAVICIISDGQKVNGRLIQDVPSRACQWGYLCSISKWS